MSWLENLRTAVEAVRAHRLRSALTMLGIVIGISSVIVTVGLGQGAQEKVRSQIDALGANLLIVSPGSSTDSDGNRGGFGSATTLTLTDAEALGDVAVAPDIAAVAPVSSGAASLTAGSVNWTSRLVGTTRDWRVVRDRALAQGRFFTDTEVAEAASVVVLAADTADELFGGAAEAVGQELRVSGRGLTVIGVLRESGVGDVSESEDDQALAPMTTVRQINGSTAETVTTIYVQARSAELLSAAYQEISAVLATRHAVDTPDFTVSTQESLVATANETNRTMTVLLAGVAAISLLVGGIGVMNIMLVSVTERFREIGLRKALGATPSVIRRQFLTEASILGLGGGVLGIATGWCAAAVLPRLIDQPVTVSVTATLAALLVALGIGIGFGVHPAARAAALAPIDALRSE
ncbi:ABC transporter permease [Nocardioides daejeonensis]|uniref:ABC transporter permease n=1 Tax=Nocardioides daejeonensis TaxID=1046556 RepID=UPI000D7507BD|nr:ABC transporter permease [Nocardioides daejeonensis]